MHAPDPRQPSPPRAVVLLSGGLDSATALACARRDGFETHALAIDYGQRHRRELDAAQAVAGANGARSFRVVALDLRAVGGSALTDTIDVPKADPDAPVDAAIPVTYVPARNLTFLSIALGLAEVLGARAIYVGVNAVDYSGYPDCRPEFVRAFEQVARLATKAAVEGEPIEVRAPLIDLSKPEIIRLGTSLGVDYALTHSCYDPDEHGLACGRCDSCRLRAAGFRDAHLPDPTHYAPGGRA
ncbi:MAG: 7-cyano-7-deazaguanine synthase QueC [Phycisphaerales bacterium]